MNSSDEELIRRIRNDLIDSYDEELEMELEDRSVEEIANGQHALAAHDQSQDREYRRQYFRELFRLQAELVKLQDWVAATGKRPSSFLKGATPPAKAA